MNVGDDYWIQYNFRCTGVFVIESLADSWKTGKELYDDIIKRKSERVNYDSYYHPAFDRKEFFQLMAETVDAVLYKKHFPILHFEIHGSEDGSGFILASGELVTWNEVAVYCRKMNVFSKNELVISLSTCHGAEIYRSLDFMKPAPFWGFIAPKTETKTGILYEDYIEFYEMFLTEKDLSPAVDTLNLYDDDCPYVFTTAEMMFDIFRETSKETPPKVPANYTRQQRRAAMRDVNNPLSGDLYWDNLKRKFLMQ